MLLAYSVNHTAPSGPAASDQAETPEEVADTIGLALQYVPREHLIACTNCGLAPMNRELALKKLQALAQGAALARQRQAS